MKRWTIILMLLASAAFAEPPAPLISSIFPAGGQQGKRVDVTLIGQNLASASSVRITGAGVSGEVVKLTGATAATLAITIAPDAEPGQRDLRILTPGGISNRFRFFVGQLPEITRRKACPPGSAPMDLAKLPVLINGQLLQGEQHMYRFIAKRGEVIVCEAAAREVLPLIADAVPGWNDTALTLFGPDGRPLQTIDDYRFHPDPVLIQPIPRDGPYTLEVHDVLYRGRADFIYRLKVGALPYITDLFPLGARRNTTTTIALRGVNLPAQYVELLLDGSSISPHWIELGQAGQRSNRLPSAIDDLPEYLEQEPNDTPATANRVTVPIAINGTIAPRDRDASQPQTPLASPRSTRRSCRTMPIISSSTRRKIRSW